MYVDRYGLRDLYVADLDAIEGRESRDEGGPESLHVVRQIADLGVPLWLDAGVSSVDRARRALALGAAHVIVGLETLTSFRALDEICVAVGGGRVAFSLDLRNGEPVAQSGIPHEAVDLLAVRAATAGVGTVIVLDLARVGTGTGLDIALIEQIRKAVPGLTLIAGGGVRGPDDLARLADAGCDGALVATALSVCV